MRDTTQTLTLQIAHRFPVAAARFTITKGGNQENHIGLPDPATVTIPPGASFATFDIALAAEATPGNTGTVSISDAVFIHTDDTNITRTTDTLVIGDELFELSIDGAADTATIRVGAQPDGTVNICARTPQVEAAILARSGVAEMDCAVAPQTALNNVTSLDLQKVLPSTATTTLKGDDFANLDNLDILNLNFNGLVSLPANVFDGLPNLRALQLGVNSLESLPANVFDDLPSLTLLNLGTNNLRSLPAGLFDDLPALDNLSLDRNPLNDPPLPAGLFQAVLDTLTNLSLDSALRTAVSIDPPTATIAPGGIQTLTAQLTNPSPATVRLTISPGGTEEDNIILPATVTIPAGMTSADFDITLAARATTVGNTGTVLLSDPALLYTDTTGPVQENTVPAVVNNLVNTLNTANNTHTFTVVLQPTATFTREHSMINEGNINPRVAQLTLSLGNAPTGPVTITYTVTITGDNIGNDADITLSDGINNSSAVIGDTANISINADGTQDSIGIIVSAIHDNDTTNEVVTFTIVSIEFADGARLESGDIQGDDVNNGALTVTIIDDDPSVTYALTDPEATEPAVIGGTPDTGTFTLTLRKLHSNQENSPQRQFFFRFDPSAATDSGLTPGSGPLHSSLTGATRASTDDFGLNVEYMQAGQTTLTVIPLAFSDGTYNNTEVNTPRAGGDTQEVYTFHVIPGYDTDNEGMETVAFGYRVHFPAAGQQAPGGANRLDGTVDGSPGKPAMTISDSTAAQPPGTFNICNRTPEVEEAILDTIRGSNPAIMCGVVSTEELDSISGLFNLRDVVISSGTLRVGDFANLRNLRSLFLNGNELTSLREGVFDGLPILTTLSLFNNSLRSLPAGLFDDVLDTLTLLEIDDNVRSTVSIEPSTVMIAPNATQTLTVRLTPPSPAIVRLTILAGGVEAEAGNVTLPDPATVTIPAGMTTATFDITLTEEAMPGETSTVVIGFASLVYTDTTGMEQENTLTDVATRLVNVPGTPSSPSSPTSTFTVAAPPSTDVNICNRTDEVRDAILAYVSEANCAAVPQTSLDTVDNSRALFINNNMSLTTLRVGDFDNLPNLTALNLGDNRLRSLHEDVFRDLSSLTILILSINNLGPSLPLRLFDGLSSLQVLNLDINSLTPPLPVGLFNDVLDSLIQLTLDDEVKSTVFIIEDDNIEIAPGILQTYTAQLIPPSPADVRLNIFVHGPIEHVMLPSTTVTIPAGMTTATFDIGLTAEADGRTTAVQLTNRALLYTDTNGDVQENTAVIGSLVNLASTATRTFTVGAPAALPTVEFTRNNGITSVNEPEGEDTLIIQFDYTIDDIPASSSFTSLAVNFGTLGPGPGYVPTFSGNLPHAATLFDPSSFDNGAVTFNDNPAFTRYNFDAGFYFSATFSENIRYQISADDNTTDDDFNLGITSVVLSGGSGGDITIPGANISVPGGRHVTAGGTTYAVQTITIMDAQTPLPVVTLTRAPSTVTEGATGQFTLDLGTVSGDVATVTYTLVVTGPNASAGDITVIPNIDGGLVVNGTGDMATINLNIGTPSRLTIAVLANADNDPDDELVTLTISRVEIADIILGPDDLVCDDCDPAAAGALSITVLDNDTPTVTLTRNQDSVTEDAGTAATFTLALRHVPNGRSTVTFTVKITGSETISPNFFGIRTDGRAPGAPPAFRLVSSNADTTLILMRSDGVTPINIDNNTANFNVHITPINDGNSTNEIITYAIDEILLPGLPDPVIFDLENIMCDNCDPRGSSSLSITIIDDEAEPPAMPAAAYDNPADITITEGGGAAASAGSTLTLTNAPNSVATVTFELAGGTAHVASLTEEADIDFSVSGGASLVIANGGMGGTFTIPAGTSEAIPTFTARNSTDSTGERITFTITDITFANNDTVAEANLPGALTINITDPTPGRIDAAIDDSVISVGETTTITFTLSNIPEKVNGVDVVRTEFIFRGFLPPGSFMPDGDNSNPGTLRTSSTYNLTISDNITNWRIRFAGHLYVNVPPTALTDEAIVITLAITAKIASTLVVTYDQIRSFGALRELNHPFDATGRSLMLVIMGAPLSSIPEAAYNNDAAVAITENGGAIVRTLTLTNAPDNNAATVSFELGGGTAHVAGLTEEADIDFSVSNGGENPTLNADGTTGTFTIPADTPQAADLSFTARADDDSTGEQLTFTITGIVFADASTVAGNDLPSSLTINVTDITPGRIEVSVSSTVINTRETADITFALRNIPSRVAGTGVVAGVEFVFGGFPPPGDFDPNSGNQQATFVSDDYDLSISNIAGLTWSIADAAGAGELTVNVPASALTGGAADITLTVDPKTAAMLTATFDRARVYDALTVDLGHTINATGSPFTVTILLDPIASYDGGDITLIEGLIPSAMRTLTLSDVPNADANAGFTLTGGVANGTGAAANANVTTPDITITVGGGADMLSLNDGGDGGTFRIPAGDLVVTITFATAPDADTVTETIAFSITEIDFAGTDTDIGRLSTLLITVGESPCDRTPQVIEAIRTTINPTPPTCGDITAAQLRGITSLSITNNVGLTSLKTGDFTGLTGLTTLNLRDNRLESLEPGDFAGLTSLTELNLRGNNLSELDSNLFQGLPTIITLHLSDNALATLPEDIFASLANLDRLNMGGNTRRPADKRPPPPTFSLPANLFNGLSNLRILELKDHANRLTSLHPDLFEGLISLQRLEINGNSGLTSLDPDLLEGLDSLTTLRLNSNPGLTTSLPPGFLDDVLDTLNQLFWPPRLPYRMLSLSAVSNDLPQGQGVFLQFNLNEPVEAGLGLRISYTVTFGEGGTADHFDGLSAGTVDIAPGMESTTIEVSASRDVPTGTTATIALTPNPAGFRDHRGFFFLYDGDGDGESDEVTVNDPRGPNSDNYAGSLVRVGDNNEQTLTIVAPVAPSSITAISVTNDPVPEGQPVAVRITLDQPLPENGGVSYTIPSRGSRAPIDNRDIFTGSAFADTPRTQTINFRTNQLFADRVAIDDNRVEPDLEEGTIRIGGIFWGESFTGFTPTENSTVGFSIEDNDAINLTLDIEDNDGISVALINGVYQVRVRESITALEVIIRAESAPIPPDLDGVILDRSITAGLMSSDGTAVNGTDFTFTDLTTTYPENSAAQAAFDPVTATINIRGNNNSGQDREFTLALSSQDRAANINTPPTSARVTIVPDTSADYDSTADITITDGVAGTVERILTLRHAPSTDATVHFVLDGGTALNVSVTNPDIILNIRGDGGVLSIDPDGMGGNFRIRAGGTDAATLVFADNPNVISAGTNIGFTITSITFDDPGTVTDIGALSEFTINISSGGNPVAIVRDTIGTLREAAPANTSTAGFTLSILNLPDDHGEGSLQLGIPQRDEDNPGRPRVGDDYRYQHQVGDMLAESPLTRSSSVVDIMIPPGEVSEDGAVDIVFTFTALDDNYDENEAIRIIFTRPVTFQNADPALNLTPSRSNFIIPIGDDDEVEATLNKSDQIPVDANELIPNRANIPSTFTVTIANAPDADARVTYTLTGGADEKYNAFLSTGPSLSSASRSFFIIREDDIIGSSPDSQGGGPGMAKATIVILPLHDADGDDEDVTLIIHSILFANGGNHANLDGGNIQGAVNGSLTLTITDEDPRPDANYTPGGDISITKGDTPVERTLTLVNAPSNIATVEFAFGGGTAGTGTESSITFSVGGGGNLAFNADDTTGTFTIPADTAATILTFAADADSTAGQLTFTITGITFDDLETITDIGPLAPLNIIITDPTPARLMVSVVNPDLETGQITDIVFALGNVPGRVGGVDVARTEFVFEGFPPADQFTPNSGTPAPLTFVSTNYDLTIISNNILGWSITGVSTGRLTVNVPASALTGRVATVTLRVTAKDVAMLTATHVMTRVFDAGDRDLGHPFTNTGDLEFTIRRPDPTGVTGIEFNNNVAENEDIAVTVTLDQPLPRDGTLRYMVLAGAADGISANDVTAGFGEASVSANADSSTFGFTVDVADDNRIDAAEQEAGAINIISVAWEDGGGFQVNDSRTFTITDNDGITLTLGIEDNDDIPVTLIDDEYQVRVRESIPTLDVSIRAEPAPDPFNSNGVILDRSITASLMSSDGTAFNNTDFTFTDLTTTYPENSAPQAAFAPVTATITIRAIDEEKHFNLTLSGDDTPNRARVTIVPDTEADYRSTSDLTIIEGGGDAASAVRILTLRYAPSTTATVNFALSGGITGLDVTADISFVVTGGVSIDFDSGGGSGNFQIPAGTDDVRLVFEDNPAVVSAGTTIVFTITDITFDDPGTVTNIGELPEFTIIINSSDEPAAIVSGTTGTPLSEAAPEDTASFTLNIRNLPVGHGNGSFQLTIPQRDAGNPERPRVGDDYEYKHQVGNLSMMSPLTSNTSVVNITIPSGQVDGEGAVNIVFTFTAVDDNYDEVDEEILIMFTQDVTFPDVGSLPPLTPSRNNFSISIGDDDQVEATLNEGDQPAVDVEGNGNNTDGTFVLTIANAPDADAMVTYTLTGEAGKYTASLSDDTSLNSTPNSVFTIPEADITGTDPNDQEDGPGTARATIVISPLHDADGDDEDVTLIIHSITFDNGSEHGNLGGGNIRGAAVNGSLTLTITDEDPRTEANYTPVGDINITEGDASTQRTLTLVNAPTNSVATVEFTFAGGTADGAGSDITFSVNGGGNLTFNADGTTGTFTIPADTATATLTFAADADPNSTGERILFTITGITFDDPATVTDIGELAPLNIIITDPTPARLTVSVGNPSLEIGQTTDIVFALSNVPERVRGDTVARTEFIFEGFPRADQFNPNSSTDAQRERTFRSDGYNLTISANIRDWSITGDGRLTVSVPASALAGEAATVTLTVTANDVADLDATHVMTQVFDDGGNSLGHSFINTGDLEFTIRRPDPTGVDIAFDSDNVAENEDLAVTVTLNQRLPRNGTLTYTVLAGAAPSISTNDVTTGFNEALVSSADANSNIFEFTVGVRDDNRIDAAEQEAGAINIISVEWEDGGGFDDNTSRTFTITDNDGITLRLDAGEYEVRDNAGTLTVTVNAAPNPIPSTHNGVILERTVTANFFTEDGAGAGAATVSEGDYVAVASGSGSAPALAFTDNLNSVAYDIVIENDDDDINETFTVNLGSDDNAVNIPTPEAAVTIVPNTTGDYGSASTTIALAEASGTSATRTLRLGHAPESAATVSFELTNGTAAEARSVFADRHALTLFVDDGATIPTIDAGNSSGRFPVQPGDDEVILRFEAAADFYGDDETITFSITGITFADEGDDTDTPADALPPDLTINITDVGAAATVTADDDDTGISELALNKAAVIRVRLTDIPSAATTAVIGFTLAGAATLSTDYTVMLAGSRTSVNSVTITKDDIDGDNRGVPQGGAPGHAEATLTFRALNDDPAGIERETIELTIDRVAFEGAPESDLAGADDIEGSSQTITIADRPLTPFATLSVGEAADVIPEDGGLSDTPNFIITLARIDSHTGTGMMAYEFSDGFSATVSSTDPADGCPGNGETTYCAFIRIAAGSLTRLTTQTGSFTFPVSSVSGEEPIDIFILPREDDDAENETVELEITSITVPQSGETITFNLDNGNLLNPDGDPVSTARITINDSAPPSVTRIEIDNAANIPEGGDIVVDVALNRPLREPATLRYRIHDAQTNSANSIAAHDVVAGAFNELTASAPVRLSTIGFTVVVIDDNRIEPTMEQGVIEIVGLDLRDETNTQVLFTANNTATFTITDNDKISLSIAGATVSENIVSLEYTVAAIAAAVPRDDRVVLDRAVAATLISTGGSATTGGANADYDGLPAAIVFPANDVARVALTSTPPVSIGINNDGEVVVENFILALTSNDPAVEIADGTASTITIAPDPRAVFNGTLTLTFTESDGPMTRTLNISNVPDNTTATVSFGVSGGTASPTDDPRHDFILTVADHMSTSILTFSGGNTNVEFTIPADRFVNGSTVITLTFTPIADEDSESEEINFGVASLMFPSNPIYDALERQESHLIITINEGALQLRIRVFLEGALQ